MKQKLIFHSPLTHLWVLRAFREKWKAKQLFSWWFFVVLFFHFLKKSKNQSRFRESLFKPFRNWVKQAKRSASNIGRNWNFSRCLFFSSYPMKRAAIHMTFHLHILISNECVQFCWKTSAFRRISDIDFFSVKSKQWKFSCPKFSEKVTITKTTFVKLRDGKCEIFFNNVKNIIK